jgi:uncharacterized membrane protein YdjX (TVP38/TMEM64 family)
LKINYKFILWILFIVVIFAAPFLVPVKILIAIVGWTRGMGFWGLVIVACLYAIGSMLFLPATIMTMAAGFLFKVVLGTITVSIGSMIGACAAFLIARTFGRKWIAARIAQKRQFKAFDHAVKLHAFKIIILTRLSPAFPNNMLNYAFGLTNIGFWKYFIVSWVGMILPTIMYVYFGSGLRSLTEAAAERPENGTTGWLYFWLGLAVTIAATLLIANLARKALKQEIPDEHEDTQKQPAENML